MIKWSKNLILVVKSSPRLQNTYRFPYGFFQPEMLSGMKGFSSGRTYTMYSDTPVHSVPYGTHLQTDYSPPHLEWFQILRGCEEAGEQQNYVL